MDSNYFIFCSSRNIEVHDSFAKAIGNQRISYDIKTNTLVVRSNNVGCESIAKMLLATHFDNLNQRMLLTKSINELFVTFQKLKTEE